MIKTQIQTTKVIGLVVGWDIMIIMAGWVEWGNLSNPMFFSFLWLNGYLAVTILDIKKEGMGLVFSNIINALYDDTLKDSTKLSRAKELLGMGANIVSFLSQKDMEAKKKADKEEAKKEEYHAPVYIPPIIDTSNNTTNNPLEGIVITAIDEDENETNVPIKPLE